MVELLTALTKLFENRTGPGLLFALMLGALYMLYRELKSTQKERDTLQEKVVTLSVNQTEAMTKSNILLEMLIKKLDSFDLVAEENEPKKTHSGRS